MTLINGRREIVIEGEYKSKTVIENGSKKVERT